MKYIVTVCRISYGFADIEVEADNEKEAKELAVEDAGNYEFSEKNSEYEPEFVYVKPAYKN